MRAAATPQGDARPFGAVRNCFLGAGKKCQAAARTRSNRTALPEGKGSRCGRRLRSRRAVRSSPRVWPQGFSRRGGQKRERAVRDMGRAAHGNQPTPQVSRLTPDLSCLPPPGCLAPLRRCFRQITAGWCPPRAPLLANYACRRAAVRALVAPEKARRRTSGTNGPGRHRTCNPVTFFATRLPDERDDSDFYIH